MISEQKDVVKEQEMYHYIAWLESEIDRCLECDLPVTHLESELVSLKDVLKSNIITQNSLYVKKIHIVV